MELRTQTDWIQIQGLPLTSWMTMGGWLNLAGPQFPICKMKITIVPTLYDCYEN